MLGIVEENLCRVRDTMILLSLGASPIDAGCSFGRISTHKAEGKGGRLQKWSQGERKKRRTLACRGGEHWPHAREECGLRRDQQDHHQLRLFEPCERC